jgi:hypothetical protein
LIVTGGITQSPLAFAIAISNTASCRIVGSKAIWYSKSATTVVDGRVTQAFMIRLMDGDSGNLVVGTSKLARLVVSCDWFQTLDAGAMWRVIPFGALYLLLLVGVLLLLAGIVEVLYASGPFNPETSLALLQ